MHDKILIADLGSQYTQLIARRVRELNVYCEIHPYHRLPSIEEPVKGVILSGSPYSIYDEDAPKPDLEGIRGKVPLLGICFGAQYIADMEGGRVEASATREYGRAELSWIDRTHELLKGLKDRTQVWMSHGDSIAELPPKLKRIASTEDVSVAAFHVEEEATYGLQFHPEVYHTSEGKLLLENFIIGECGCKRDWTPRSFVEDAVEQIRGQVGEDHVLVGLSGGVDSSVAATLLHRAIGQRSHCLFIDNGLLRKNEFDEVLAAYDTMGLNVKGIDAKERFYEALRNVTDPEEKRRVIGKTFIEVFDEEAERIVSQLPEDEKVRWLGQGTIYPDVIESLSVKGPSATIKSHHNVGGLPERMNMQVVEPLRALFKDEVRRVGRSLGLEDTILRRHPFPGPGLAIRIIGDVTPEKVTMLQEADAIFIKALREWEIYDEVWQAGAVLLPIHSVGVMGDERTYEQVVALRAVTSTDGMTADRCHLPYELLGKVSDRIINQVQGINRVVYDISSKPPATIEWE